MRVHYVLPICASVITYISHGSAREQPLLFKNRGGLRRPDGSGFVLLNQLLDNVPSASPTQSPTAIKECDDTSNARIRFNNGETRLPRTVGRCSDITENGWEDLACPQENAVIGAEEGEMIYETCGNECPFWTGCGLVITESPSDSPSEAPTTAPSASPSASPSVSPSHFPTASSSPSASPTYIKECEDNARDFVRFRNADNIPTRVRCEDILVNAWESLACPQRNMAVVNTQLVYEMCGYECSAWSNCGLPLTE